MRTALVLSLAAGCVPVEPSGNPFVPVPSATPKVQAPARPSAADKGDDGGGFDFEAEDRGPAGAPRDDAAAPSQDPLAQQARLLDQAKNAPPMTVPAVSPTAAPVWDPSIPVPEAGFGVRVVTVLLDIQPPRAILGLPDGSEQVVTPGAMVPSQGLVVLAIGRDAVQLAKISPNGYAAKVDTETLRALYPSGSSGLPPVAPAP